jgi:hypothetical protein
MERFIGNHGKAGRKRLSNIGICSTFRICIINLESKIYADSKTPKATLSSKIPINQFKIPQCKNIERFVH